MVIVPLFSDLEDEGVGLFFLALKIMFQDTWMKYTVILNFPKDTTLRAGVFLHCTLVLMIHFIL